MNKKYIIIGITCGFVIISGFCYSCSYKSKDSAGILSTALKADENKQEGKNQNIQEPTAAGSKDEGQKLTLERTSEGTLTGIPKDKAQEDRQAMLYVHICGAVGKPGVYQVTTGTRICDLIEIAGGLSKDAAGDYINQAEPAADGERVYIPTKKEVEKLTAEQYQEGAKNSSADTSNNTKQSEKDRELIDINSAGAEELMSLPGIGQAKADLIIKYRSDNGSFQKKEDLMNISGIKEGLFNKISSYIIVK